MQVTREVISDLAASKYQMVEWRSVLDGRLESRGADRVSY